MLKIRVINMVSVLLITLIHQRVDSQDCDEIATKQKDFIKNSYEKGEGPECIADVDGYHRHCYVPDNSKPIARYISSVTFIRKAKSLLGSYIKGLNTDEEPTKINEFKVMFTSQDEEWKKKITDCLQDMTDQANTAIEAELKVKIPEQCLTLMEEAVSDLLTA